MKYVIALFFVLFVTLTRAQHALTRNLTAPLYNSSSENLKLAWAGGLNSVHLSEIDLNLDGIMDLFIYDLTGGRITTYINNGTAGEADYTYAPEYQDKFPKTMEAFVIFADYNNDGKNDLFTYFGLGVKVFKNVSTQAEGLKFQDVTSNIQYPYLLSRYAPGPAGVANLFVTRGDIPAITDVDNDGDLDILAFGNSASTVYYHQNMAADSGNLEEFNFHVATSCWGNFEEDFNSELLTLNISCKGGGGKPNDKGNKHAGSTLLAIDVDGDHDKDLLVGDISSNHLILLTNGGDSLYADMISQTNEFPPGPDFIDIVTYPSAHYLDVNNDGKKDLIISPNTLGSVENEKSVWFYKNTGTTESPVFTFETDDFLQSEMVDMGNGAYPAFFDYNNDSIPDLVIGNHGFYNDINLPVSLLRLYETDEAFNFRLKDEDLAGISSAILNLNLSSTTLDVAPAFGDLDGDGDADLLIGDFEGKIHYYKNVAASGQPTDFQLEAANFLDIDVGGYAVPQIFDLNRDSKPDLLIGERSGNINYYQNTGTRLKPEFTLKTENLGEVNVIPAFEFNGFSYPFFFLSNDSIKLLCGSQSGRLYFYDQIDGHLDGKFRLVDSAFGGISEGQRSTVAGEDINNDGMLDLIVGNYAGGVALFSSDIPFSRNGSGGGGKKNNNDFDYEILPVPSLGEIRINSNMDGFTDLILDVEIFDVRGRKVFSKPNTSQKAFDLRYLSKGVFYMKIRYNNEEITRKFITQ